MQTRYQYIQKICLYLIYAINAGDERLYFQLLSPLGDRLGKSLIKALPFNGRVR